MTDQRKYTNKLAGKHVLVIGGSSGIGYGVAEASLEHGARVTISSSNSARLAAAVERLSAAYPSAAAGARIASHACDLGTEETLEANVAALFAATCGKEAGGGGGVDHVVYSAGDALATLALADATLPAIKQAGMVRFFGPLLAAKHAARYLPRSPEASFTITSGAVAEKPMPGWAVIGSYAGGQYSMARGLALDMKPVRVNIVSPGAVDTELWRMSEEEKKAMFKSLGGRLATGRVGEVVDVAEAFLYIMKDSNVTGSHISTNGGSLLI